MFVNNTHHQSDGEKCEVFADFFEKAFTPNEIVDPITADIVEDSVNSVTATVEHPIKYATPSEVLEVIKKLPLKKSPGIDLIPNILLKNLSRKAMAFLTSILNACLSKGYFPNSWKKAEIIVIHKPNKPKHQPSSYRPISLLSTLSKVLEKIIQKRLLHFINLFDAIPPHQFGFRQRHSTSHQVQRIVEIITKGFEQRKHTTAAFLDVAQAFDKVWHDGLIHKVKQLGLPSYLNQILKSFLKNREFCVRVNNSFSSLRKIVSGVPQGSILGPLLFNIFMSDIPIPEDTELALYADDTAILTQNSNIQLAFQKLQNSVNEITQWFNKWRLFLNPIKCETKIFTLKTPEIPPNIKINNSEINWNPQDQAIKYLGISLDKKLNWNLHINLKLAQAYSRLSLLFPILNRRSSLKISCTTLIYKSILRPLVMYGCPIWGMSLSKSKLNKIQIFQNKVLRIATNAPWFVRNSQIQKELGIAPIQTFIQKTTTKFKSSLHLVPSALHFRIGEETVNRRLKPRLFQDIL